MVEYLDYYDEDWNFLWKETRENVHANWLWHNTVHCRLYTKQWDILFQIRADTHTFYTTASWHVLSGETIKQAFNREIMEELWIDIDSSDAEFVSVVPWKLDKQKSDWTWYRDRAKAHVYVDLYEWDYSDFDFDPAEIQWVAVVNAKETLQLFTRWSGEIQATIVTNNWIQKEMVGIDRFLVTQNEIYLWKYGDILGKVISLSKI